MQSLASLKPWLLVSILRVTFGGVSFGQVSSVLQGNEVVIVDELLPGAVLEKLHDLSSHYGFWVYNDNSTERSQSYIVKSSNTLRWVSYLDPAHLRNTQLWAVLVRLLQQFHGDADYYPVRINSIHIRRLDSIEMIQECDDGSSSRDVGHLDILMTLYLNKIWLKNDYGELILFNKTTKDIVASVVPKYGRLIMWNCDIPYVYKPPSVAYKQGQYGLVLRASQSVKSFEMAKSFYQNLRREHKHNRRVDFSQTIQHGLHMTNGAGGVHSHMTRLYHDSKNRPVAVYDDLFSNEEIQRLQSDLVKPYNTFLYQPYDEGVIQDSDNVQWIVPVSVAAFVKTPLWKIFQYVTQDTTGITDWYPYDVSMNVIRSAEHTRIHADCEDWEEEYTLLVYLNPEFDTPDSHGETVFFEEISSSDGEHYHRGNEMYEIIAAVRPRFGRVAIFNGMIPHSARPPNIHVAVTRYTFAVKVMRTERVALSKALIELLEGEQDRTPDEQSQENRELLSTLTSEMAQRDPQLYLPSVDELRENVQLSEEIRDRFLTEGHANLLKEIEHLLKEK